MARNCSWQNPEGLAAQRSTYWFAMTPEGCILYVTLHPQTESPHRYAPHRKCIRQQLYWLQIMKSDIWWTGHVWDMRNKKFCPEGLVREVTQKT